MLAFGSNEFGQLGVPHGMAWAQHAVSVPASCDAASVSCGARHTAVLDQGGNLYTAGSNNDGELGLNDHRSRDALTVVQLPQGCHVASVCCGDGFTVCVLIDEAPPLAFGSAELGQLGAGANAHGHASLPSPVAMALPSSGVRVSQAACGADFTLLATMCGRVFASGANTFGQLGLHDDSSRDAPCEIESLWPYVVRSVAAGRHHAGCLTLDGYCFTWGRSRYGALGLVDSSPSLKETVPRAVQTLSGWRTELLAMGAHHTLVAGSALEQYSKSSNSEGYFDTVHYAVFGFGNNDRMQASGSGSEDPTCARPVRIPELEKVKVLSIAAGEAHSACIDHTGQLWTWGDKHVSGLVQACDSTAASFSEPQTVPNTGCLASVSCGRYHTFASQTILHDLSLLPDRLRHLLESLGQADADNQQHQGLFCMVKHVFRSPAMLSSCFATRSALSQPDSWRGASLHYHGLDIKALQWVYRCLLSLPRETSTKSDRWYDKQAARMLGESLSFVVDSLLSNCGEVTDPSSSHASCVWLQAALAVLVCPLISLDEEYRPNLFDPLVRCFCNPNQLFAECCVHWLACLPPELIVDQLLKPAHQLLNNFMHTLTHSGEAPVDLTIEGTVRFLHACYEANLRHALGIPKTEFQNTSLSKTVNLKQEYLHWVGRSSNDSEAATFRSFCKAPFLLTTEAKKELLRIEQSQLKSKNVRDSQISELRLGMQSRSRSRANSISDGANDSREANASGQENMVTPQNDGNVTMSGRNEHRETPFLELRLRREHLLDDTIAALSRTPRISCKKPLLVRFEGEFGVDDGGVTKEFFTLVVSSLFSSGRHVFYEEEDSSLLWPTQMSDEDPRAYEERELAGMIIGLAIYNDALIDATLPLAFWKKLLGVECGFEDFAEIYPSVAQSFDWMINQASEDDIDSLGLTFEISQTNSHGNVENIELIESGANVNVTWNNTAEYVDQYVHYVMDRTSAESFAALARGMHTVCGGPALNLLTPEELELLACGRRDFDIMELSQYAEFEGGFHSGSDAVQWLWDTVCELSIERQRAFLAFVTGSKRTPVGGLADLRFRVQRSGPDTDKLPTAHVCFNTLLLPEYCSQQKLKDRLITAIENSEGFGLR